MSNRPTLSSGERKMFLTRAFKTFSSRSRHQTDANCQSANGQDNPAPQNQGA